MISVVMPYWQRTAALALNLARYRELYPAVDLEIIIVDDGSPRRARIAGEYPWSVRIIRLPDKRIALNPSLPLNIGVGAASGELIVLTSPEVVHRFAILEEMVRRVKAMGPRSYLAAACWSPARKRWYCHSTERAKGPEKAGLHFCAMLPRAIYEEVGGFDEKYRGGQAYEDVDFLWRLSAGRVQCQIADDLITDHIKTARSQWPIGGLQRNKAIFERRWKQRLAESA